MATVSKPFKILQLHYEVKSWHHAKFELFLTYFSFSSFPEMIKSIFEVVRHNLFACPPSDFSSYFSTIICVPIVAIWITCIKRKENAINHLNIANEARKMPNLHNNYFMVYVEHIKKSSTNNEGASTLFQNLSGSFLKQWNFIGYCSICEHSTLQ